MSETVRAWGHSLRSRGSQSSPDDQNRSRLGLRTLRNGSRRNLSGLALLAILLLAMALRIVPWGQNRFLEDEALYAYWGLQIATGADPMLDEEPVDKPPLYPYTLALSFLPFESGTGLPQGALEAVARLPSLFASLVSIALVYALARALYDDAHVGLLAALLLALSPFDLSFAATAFTDPLLTALVLGALLAAARGRLGVAGLLCGLAAATKQQALLFLPLIVALGILFAPASAPSESAPSRRQDRLRRAGWLWFVLAFALVVAGALWWDAARLQRPGFLEQSLISYGGLAPAGEDVLADRAAAWLDLVGNFWILPAATVLIFGAIGIWFVAGGLLPRSLVTRIARPTKADWLLLAFVLAYLFLHWLLGFQVWDRYLLPLVPLTALLAARALVALGSALPTVQWRWAYAGFLALLLAVTLVGPLVMAMRSELPLGGDHGAYDGIDDLATYMSTQAPPDSVLYHYWLGYHYRFYLYGRPLRLHWYPDLEDLARDAYVYRREPRYIAFPSWLDSTPVETTLSNAGIALEPAFATTRRDGTISFRLYRLVGPSMESDQTQLPGPAPLLPGAVGVRG